jgi:hypothetical protein
VRAVGLVHWFEAAPLVESRGYRVGSAKPQYAEVLPRRSDYRSREGVTDPMSTRARQGSTEWRSIRTALVEG